MVVALGVAAALNNPIEELKDLETGVPKKECVPYLLGDGTLVIPFNSPQRFHWGADDQADQGGDWEE